MTSIAKSRAKYAIRESGVPYTMFRATMFMETLPMLTRGGRALLFGDKPAPFHWLAAKDYAQMVVRAFDTPAAAGHALYPRGPQGLTLPQAFEIYRNLVLPGLKVMTLPPWLLDVTKTVVPRPSLVETATMLKMFGTESEGGDPCECNRLLARASTNLEEWCIGKGKRGG